MPLNAVQFGAQVRTHLTRLYPRQKIFFPASTQATKALDKFITKVEGDKSLPRDMGIYLWCTDTAGSMAGDLTCFAADLIYRSPDGQVYKQEHHLDASQLNGHYISIGKFRHALEQAYQHAKNFAAQMQAGDTSNAEKIDSSHYMLSTHYHTGDSYMDVLPPVEST